MNKMSCLMILMAIQFQHSVAILTQSEIDSLKTFFASTVGNKWTSNFGWYSIDSDICDKDGSVYGISCVDGRLAEINLRFNNLKGVLPGEIGKLTTLKKINLEYNFITGEIPKEVGNLVNLEKLNLAHNNFNGTLRSEFLRSQIKEISLKFTNISGNIPIEFCSPQSNLEILLLEGTRICPTCDYSSVPENDFASWLPRIQPSSTPLFCDDKHLLAVNSSNESACGSLCRDPLRNYSVCVDFKCRPGYEIVADGDGFQSNPICQKDGTWKFTSCEPKKSYCSVDDLENGYIVSPIQNGIALGEKVKLGCKNGFSFLEDGVLLTMERTCVSNDIKAGILDGPYTCYPIHGYCERKTGNLYFDLANKEITRDIDSGESVKIHCKEGYEMSDGSLSKEIVCSSFNQTIGKFTDFCRAKSGYCIARPPTNGTINESTKNQELSIGQKAVYKCAKAFSFGGVSISPTSMERKCLADTQKGGILNKSDFGECIAIIDYCTVSAPLNGLVDKESVSFGILGNLFVFQCRARFRIKGYEALSVSKKCVLFKQTTGILDDVEELMCVPIVCVEPSPKNGFINGESGKGLEILAGEFAVYSCATFYVSDGKVSQRECVVVDGSVNAFLEGDPPNDCVEEMIEIKVSSENGDVLCAKNIARINSHMELESVCEMGRSKISISHCPQQRIFDPKLPISYFLKISQKCSSEEYDGVVNFTVHENAVAVEIFEHGMIIDEGFFDEADSMDKIYKRFDTSEEIDFLVLTNPNHGTLKGTNLTIGELLRDPWITGGHLDRGFVQIVKIEKFCIADAPFGGLLNGKSGEVKIFVGNTFEFSCDYGFESNDYLNANRIVLCDSSDMEDIFPIDFNVGKKITSPFKCSEIKGYCKPTTMKNMVALSGVTNSESFQINSFVVFKCFDGFSDNGSTNKVAQCIRKTAHEGEFSHYINCKAIESYCAVLPSEGVSSNSTKSYPVHEIAIITCDKGYETLPGKQSLEVKCLPFTEDKGIFNVSEPFCFVKSKSSCGVWCISLILSGLLILVGAFLVSFMLFRRHFNKRNKLLLQSVGTDKNLKQTIEHCSFKDIPEIVAGITCSKRRRDILKLLREVHVSRKKELSSALKDKLKTDSKNTSSGDSNNHTASGKRSSEDYSGGVPEDLAGNQFDYL